MSLQKWVLASMALCVTAGVSIAEPMRTLFTKENKFPGAMGVELSLAGGGSSYDGGDSSFSDEDVSTYFVAPGVRFGLADRLTVLAEIPYAGYSADDMDESGLGDIALGTEFLFFEDIFEYAWIIPHATAILATGDEDKGLGKGEGQGRLGLSIGTTVDDVLHYAVDVSYTINGACAEEDGDYDDLLAGSLSLIWDLDARSSILGEVQVRDDNVDPDDDYAVRGHLGLAFKITQAMTIMAYGGGASGLAEDFYGMGRLVYSF